MTKKPSEKNKAWEKERRDRLNKSFDSLAKLLPNYDPSIVWTKIEIIQKSILYIEVLQQRNKKYLSKKDPQELKKYNELIDAIKYFQLRNGQLSELLRKSKITLPPFNLPKYLCDNTSLIENYSEQSVINNSDIKSETQKEINENPKEINKNTKEDNLEKNVPVIRKAELTNNKKLLKTTKIKSIKENKKIDDFKSKTVRTVTVTSTVKPDVLVAEEVKLENDIPLTDTTICTDKIPSLSQILLPSNSFVPSTIPTTILPTLIKIENLPLNKKLKNSNPNQIIRKLAKDQNGKIKILPQPHLKLYYRRADGKMPIPVIRKKIIVPIKKRKSCKRKLINIKNNENCPTKKIKLKTENYKAENVNENVICESKIEEVKNVDIKTTNLNLLNVDKNSGTVSPTAAFLESFPVVASTTNSAKLGDTLNNIGQVDVNPKICETAANNAENLENLNNFFATKEYSNYCAQATEIISQDSINIIDDKNLENCKVELIKSPSKLRKTEIKILENIKIETNLPPVPSKQIIQTDNPILNEKITTSSSMALVSTTNNSISNTNSIFTTFPPITTANSLTLQSVAYSSPSSTLNLMDYISPPATTIFTPSTQFLSNYPDFSNSIVRKSNVKRNSCKFNLSTKGPICTPLPLDSKNFITQNYSGSNNCKMTSSNITTLLPQTTVDNFNISKTGNSAMNFGPLVATTSGLLTTNIMSGQNIPKMFINNSTTSVTTAENIVTTSTFPYTTDSAELQSNNLSLPLVNSSKNIENHQNYQTSFENFNLKTYSASTNVTPETSKKSVDKTMKISTKNSKSLLNIVNCTVKNSIIPSTYTSTYSSSVSIPSTNSNMSHSANLYQGISTLNQSFVNNNSTLSQTSTDNLTPTTSVSDSTCNLNYSKTIKESINSVGYSAKNVDTNLPPPQYNPYSMTGNSTNSLNTSIQSNTIDVKYSLNNYVPPAISSNTISSLTYSYCTNSSTPTDVKSESIKFHPYAANFGIPITTAVNISTNIIPTVSTATVNAISNYPTTKSIMNCVSSKNPIISSTHVTYTTTFPITMSTKSSNTAKLTTSNLISPFLHTKSTDKTNYQPFTSSVPSNVMSSSSTNRPITTSQFLLRPYDFVTNTTGTNINSPTVPSSYLPSIPYTTTKTKQTNLPSNYIFSTCTSSASNYSHPIFTNLSTTIDNNNYSTGNSVYSNPSKNYYYPLKQSETSTTFSFSLTTTTNSKTTPLITPQTQPSSVLTYPTLKSEIPPPWLPTPTPPTSDTITTDFKTPFTFSLTPTTAILTTTTTKSPAPCITSAVSNNFILKNPQNPLNSYNSTTNFTFCLTTPKTTTPVDGSSHKSINLISKNYQSNYPIYNSAAFVDTQLNFNQKDTTNFTFALTKSTNSVSDSTPKPSKTIIPNNNKFDNLYTNNAITLQNTVATTVAGQFKNSSTTNKVKNGNTQKLNKKNIAQISNNNEQNYYDCEQNKSCDKVNQKSHVNWMTSSASENTTITKKAPLQQYYPTQNNESILPWSPNKIYDNNLQQTYYGGEITNHYTECPTQNLNQNLKFYNNIVKNEKYIETIPPTSSIINNQSSNNNNNNNNNFFSVSQLVDQSSVPSKIFTNSSSSTQNFDQTSCQHSKISPINSRTTIIKDIKTENQTNHLLNLNYTEREEQKPLTISNTYSAEALISKKEKHRNFNPTNCNNNNNINNPTDFCSSSIDQLDTIISDQNNYHTNNYFYNYHHHQQSINHQNYTIQSEIDYLGGNNINSLYENDEYNKTILNKIDKKLYPPSSYPPPIPPAPPPPTSSLSTSNSFNTNVTTFIPYDTNYGHIQYYHGTTTNTTTTTTTTTATNSSANNNSNYHHHHHHQPSNWTKGLQYTNSSCIIPQYHHSQQILPPILGEHHNQHGQQSTINSQTVTGNLTNFNLSSICPEINDKVNSSGRNNEW